MGLTWYLILLYLALLAVDVFAFLKCKKGRKWAPFIMISAIMVIGIVVLGCLWLASPM